MFSGFTASLISGSRNLKLGGPGLWTGGPFGRKTMSLLGSMELAMTLNMWGPSVLNEDEVHGTCISARLTFSFFPRVCTVVPSEA